MLINASHLCGCRLTTKYSFLQVSINRKATYRLPCCHGVTVRKMGEFKFNGDDVGQCNVIKEHIKCLKTGGAMRGMCGESFLVVQILCLISLYDFVPVLHHKFIFSICSTNFFYLTLYPQSFSVSYVIIFSYKYSLLTNRNWCHGFQIKKRDIVKKKIIKRKHCAEKTCQANARHSITTWAPTSEEECPIRFCVYLNGSNHWYLHSHGSCLDHKHHPKLDVKAVTLSEKDMSHDEIQLTTLLYDVNVPPSTIAKVLTTIWDDDVGTFLPKTVFNINEKSRSLIDVANGILPTCSDAEKTLILLQM